MTHTASRLSTALAAALVVAAAPLAPAHAAESDKTLVAWASPANLDQQGGSVLTVQSGTQFDAIVIGEKSRGKWMAGSDMFHRTQANQNDWPAETAKPADTVQLAIVYEGDQVRIYRDGEPYAEYKTKNIDLLSIENAIAVFGLRHVGAGSGTNFAGSIDDARIYDKALTADQIKALKPNAAGEIKPVAWWDFQGNKPVDQAGRFAHCLLMDGAMLAEGRLVLDGTGYMVAAKTEQDAKRATSGIAPRGPAPPYVPDTPAWPVDPPANWLSFHLAHPGPGPAMPGDPNCLFDYKGKVHYHYIYRNSTGFVFAHLSSDDMVHWKWHPTVLAPPTTGHGMFSGTGFYTRDGKPAIIYHGEGAGRNVIQFPKDDSFDSWTDPIAVLPRDANGQVPKIRMWDPDCWLMNDTYYAYTGGQNPQLMKSTDLENWTYLGDLLHPDYPADLGIPRNEDISCGNMFKLGDKWMLLCISHSKGARYYLGDFKDEKYLPSYHAMMSFGGNQYFAPESVLTRDGRRVMWAWIMNLPVSPTGVQSLPRELELPADGVLRIRPLRELAKLRHDEKARPQFTVADASSVAIDDATGDALEIEITVAAPLPREFTVTLLGDAQGQGGVSVVAGAGRKSLKVSKAEAPFELREGEDLTLRLYVDKNLVEVFANDRQAAAFAAPKHQAEPNVRVAASGGEAVVKSVKVWKMKSIYERQPAPVGQAAP